MGNQPAPKAKLRKGLWSPEEDEKLVRYITKYGHKCWSIVPKQAGLQRCGKSCRLRWINYLRPDLKRGHFTQEEEELIVKLHAVLGNRWAQIATQLPGRTDNEIKNFWNSCLRKKLRQIGIDPQTHKPLAELLPLRVGNVVPLHDGGEVLQQDDNPMSSFGSRQSLLLQQQQQQQLMMDDDDDSRLSAEASDNNNFTMSMLPVTYNPMSKNCQGEESSKHWGSRASCCSSKAHPNPMLDDSAAAGFHLIDGFKLGSVSGLGSMFSDDNNNNNNSSPCSGFSACLQLDEQQTSSGETGGSEIINTFPLWEACSNSGIKAGMSEGNSWGFGEGGIFYPQFKWGLGSDSMLEGKMESSEAIGWQLNHDHHHTGLYDEPAASDPLSISAVLDQM